MSHRGVKDRGTCLNGFIKVTSGRVYLLLTLVAITYVPHLSGTHTQMPRPNILVASYVVSLFG